MPIANAANRLLGTSTYIIAPRGAERALGGTRGHQYAAEVLDGGTGRAFAGHGELRSGAGDFIVPQGTAVTLPRRGIRILDETGGFIERGDWDGLAAAARTNPRIARDVEGLATYLPGASVPNYTLKAPTNRSPALRIYSRSTTVEDATPLSQLLDAHMGPCEWAACTEFRR